MGKKQTEPLQEQKTIEEVLTGDTKRTHAQIVSRAPAVVTLGEATYEITPLVIAKSEAWRAEFANLFDQISGLLQMDTTKPVEMIYAAKKLIKDMPADLYEMVFAYSEPLQKVRDKIREEATDEQMYEAVKVVLRMTYPFAAALESAIKLAG